MSDGGMKGSPATSPTAHRSHLSLDLSAAGVAPAAGSNNANINGAITITATSDDNTITTLAATSNNNNNGHRSGGSISSNKRSNSSSLSSTQPNTFITLESMDIDGAGILTSPRSIEACASLGIQPSELLRRPEKFFQDIARSATEATPYFVKRRSAHYEQKRAAKMTACLERRRELIHEEESGGGGAASRSVAGVASHATISLTSRQYTSRALEVAQDKIKKIQAKHKREVRNLINHEVKRQVIEEKTREAIRQDQIRQEEERQRAFERKRAYEEYKKRETEERLAAQKSAEIELARRQLEAHEVRQQELAAEREEQRQLKLSIIARDRERQAIEAKKRAEQEAAREAERQRMNDKEEQMRLQEEQRLALVEEARRDAAAAVAASRDKAAQRFLSVQENQNMLLEEKRRELEERKAQAAARKDEFEAAKALEVAAARQRAQEKAQQLARAQDAAAAALEAKAAAQRAREEEALKRLDERERLRLMDEQQRRKNEEQRHLQRLEVAEINRELEAQRVRDLEAKQQAQEERRLEAAKQAADRAAEKKVEERLLAEDREEQVQRMKRIKEYRTNKLLARLEQDTDRINDMKEQMKQLHEERRKLRVAGERHRELMAISAVNIRKQQTILSSDGTVNLNAIGLAPELTAALLESEEAGASSASATSGGSPLSSGGVSLTASPKTMTPSSSQRGIGVRATTSYNNRSPSTSPTNGTAERPTPPKRLPTLGASPSAPSLRSPLSSTSPLGRTSFGGGPSRTPVRRNVSTSHGRLNATISSNSNTASPKSTGSPSLFRHDPLAALASSPYAITSHLPVQEGSRRIFAGPVPLTGSLKSSGYVLNGGKKGATNTDSTNRTASSNSTGGSASKTKSGNGHSSHSSDSSLLAEERRRAEQQIEEFQAKQNSNLLDMIEREQAKEEERKKIYDRATIEDRSTLDTQFAAERAEASERIANMTKSNEAALRAEMDRLGLLDDDDLNSLGGEASARAGVSNNMSLSARGRQLDQQIDNDVRALAHQLAAQQSQPVDSAAATASSNNSAIVQAS